MNESQRDHIVQNLTKLLDFTQLNACVFALLRQKKILLWHEVDALQTKLNSKGKYEANSEFYETIVKNDVYEELIQVMEESNQSGVATILRSISISPNLQQASASATSSTPGTDRGNSTEKRYRELVIGDDDGGISVGTIREHIDGKSLLKGKVADDWKTLATKLGFDLGTKEKWSKNIMLDKSTEMDVFEKMLTDWALTLDKEATLGKFLDILKEMKQWKAVLQSLERQFSSLSASGS